MKISACKSITIAQQNNNPRPYPNKRAESKKQYVTNLFFNFVPILHTRIWTNKMSYCGFIICEYFLFSSLCPCKVRKRILRLVINGKLFAFRLFISWARFFRFFRCFKRLDFVESDKRFVLYITDTYLTLHFNDVM